MGVGAVESAAKVRWVTARTIIWAWFLTIPATAVCSALCFWAIRFAMGLH
jgi:PiT family inorganic phosphate transporter